MRGTHTRDDPAAHAAQALILWLDCDREGENIAMEVVDCCRRANGGLQVLRAHFSAVTHQDIMRALGSLTPPDEAKSEVCGLGMGEWGLGVGS